VKFVRHFFAANLIGFDVDSTEYGEDMKEVIKKKQKISFFGNFGAGNLGNESSLKAILYHVFQRFPDAEVNCICTVPEVTARIHKIAAVPINDFRGRHKPVTNLIPKFLRRVIITIPVELFRWLNAFRTLRGQRMLIVPGTGLLTDAYGFTGCGPYDIFRWSLIAKLCHCELLFVSVGAGPIYSTIGRWLIKTALSLADLRSYRDNSTMQCLKRIGVPTNNDRVYPDLAFNLPKAAIPHDDNRKRHRPVVGINLMCCAGQLCAEKSSDSIHQAYLKQLMIFAKWLLGHEYDIRLLIGDLSWDTDVTKEFTDLLKQNASMHHEGDIIHEPALSVEQLLSQIAETDLVVATRFHTALLALVLSKPVICISFHHKCVSLMSEMGLSEYCQDIKQLDASRLIEKFCDLEKNAKSLRSLIKEKTEERRRSLEEQYTVIFNSL
jgi:polysaccharide pyruvyl transferase WcaK-like protein